MIYSSSAKTGLLHLCNSKGLQQHHQGIPWKINYRIGWVRTHCISHGTYGTEIDEQEIENLLNKRSDSEYENQNDNEL